MSVHVSSVSSFDFPSDVIIIAHVFLKVKLGDAENYLEALQSQSRQGFAKLFFLFSCTYP